MKFNKIACVDYTKMNNEAIAELQQYSEEEVIHPDDFPESNEEILKRIGDAEVIFVSWKTQITEEIIKECPNLKYIGMCCSLFDDASANVAVNYAREKGITVTGIFDYGDPGVAEFVISELIMLIHGYAGKQWQEIPQELTDRKIGIIGLGVTGQLLADCLLPFGADLYYYSRSKKPQYEQKGLQYLELEELLETVEIISIHLPKNVEILQKEHFDTFGEGKILINTSLGLPFDLDAFRDWIKSSGNFGIFDGDAKKDMPEDVRQMKNVIIGKKSAGWTQKTQERLSEKVLNNFKEYLQE
ncbi:NAD(P)-dependent oxidoreductase [Zunongwangia endophytica]|uniref:NAD(P)-dependent oxidoreductase n=1 Tax=Zunongwangia endophytica TaxID=1808945 RepID=A0ABV8HCZ5_9FLAO|nr:NAD(P)-dependent oxidoreductase [Zunongwangia endophytica]MDN3593769.1 NAD(P)-dependent oxidoreductase [Zunongwangia endophytica]